MPGLNSGRALVHDAARIRTDILGGVRDTDRTGAVDLAGGRALAPRPQELTRLL